MVPPAPLVSLLITTYNRKDDLLRTLGRASAVLGPEHEIVVYDDGSDDGTSDAVAHQFPQIRLISEGGRNGYTAARNKLLRAARGEYAISLDDDAEIVTPECVPIILDHFRNYPQCGVISFSVFWGIDLPEQITAPAATARRVASFVGCGHAWRLEAWRTIPEYPEWFEFYGEEDFAALQLLKSGWEVHYVPQVVVHHRVDLAKRKSNNRERLWRYGRQLRSGTYLILLFFPLTALPRRLAYVIWTQIRLRLFRQHDWRVLPVWLWVFAKIVTNTLRIWQSRTALGPKEWAEWNALPPAVIYWEPSTKTGNRGLMNSSGQVFDNP